MNKPEHFETLEDHAVFRPTGKVSLERAVQLITPALVYARELHIEKLLMVITGLTGFELPSLGMRYFLIRDWADATQGNVCVAMVARPEMIDFEEIGVVVAKNAGFCCNIFALEEEALAWLQNVKWVGEVEKIQFTRG